MEIKRGHLQIEKAVILLYLSIGVEGRKFLNSKNPHIIVESLTTAGFWKILQDAFIRT